MAIIPDEIRKNVGKEGEEIAAQFLARRGYRVIEKNYRRKWGEIDIIALKDNTVRFVEVKAVSREILPNGSREMPNYRPEEQVHPTKLKKICRTAELYMANTKDDREFQIDVVGVFLDMRNRKARCRLLEQVL